MYVFRVIFIIIFFILSIICNASSEIPTIINGYVDLSDFDFEKNTFRLRGTWEFYENKLLFPEEISLYEKEKKYVKIPKIDNYKGFNTYVLTIKGLKKNNLYGLELDSMLTSYKLFVDGNLIAQNGIVAKTKKNYKAEYRPCTALFQPLNEKTQIVIQVANFSHRATGIWAYIILGKESIIKNREHISIIQEAFLFGSILIMSFYHFGLFFMRKKELSFLYFGLYCLVIAIRNIFTGKCLINYFINLPWEIFIKIEYLSFYFAGPLMVFFIYSLYKEEFNIYFIKFIKLITIVFGAIVILTPPYIFTYTLTTFQLITILGSIYIIHILIKSAIHKKEGAFIFLVAFLVTFATIINDIICVKILYVSNYIAPIGLFVFIILQSFLLSVRYSKAFKLIEKLSNELSIYSKELEIKNEDLKQLNRMKDEFLANTSHELKTPLNGIIGITDYLIEENSNNKELIKNLDIIMISAKRLLRIVNNILDFSNLKKQRIEIYKESIDLKKLVDSIITLIKIEKKSDIEIKNKISENLKIYADKIRFEQVIYNLLENAVKFTLEGEVSISALEKSDFIEISIKDTGIGIPKDKQTKIFEPFEQADGSTEREFCGTGLGLSITKEIIELHDGKIWVDSDESIGTTFTFIIPK